MEPPLKGPAAAPGPAGEPAVLAGRYRVARELGRGASGAVYEAEVLASPGRRVAVKVLDRPELHPEELEARFHREVRNALRLRHPHSVRIFDYGALPDGRLYFTMELCAGRSLGAVLAAEGPLDPVRAVRLARQVLSALAAAHEIGMVHRDVKPDNIQVFTEPDGRERATLLDFGLAKVGGGRTSQDLTRGGARMGTVEYMSPEQVLGKGLDGRSDIYSLAATLHELLSGCRPFAAADAEALALAIVTEAPVCLGRRAGGRVSEALARAVDRGLAKRPAERYPDAPSFAAALLEAEPRAAEPGAGDAPVGSPPESPEAVTVTGALPGLLPSSAGGSLSLGGRYALERLHEEARGARLHEGVDLETGARVAVQVLAGSGPIPEEDWRRHLLRVEALRRIAHRNVVRLLDAGLAPSGAPYFVLEWVAGTKLSRLLGRRAAPPAAAAGALCQVLAGLEAAHARGVVHGDLTAECVLATRAAGAEATLALCGFEAVRFVPGKAGVLPAWGSALGTLRAAPPEQLLGRPLDARADVFAAGALLFEMLAARPPFPGDDAADVARAILHGPPAALPRDLPEATRASVEPIVARALARERASRFPSATAFLEALAPLAGPLVLADLEAREP